MTEEPIGRITHVWPRAGAAGIALDETVLRVGDRIRIEGPRGELVETVETIELAHERRPEAHPGEDVAIGVSGPVHAHDHVFLLRDTGGPKE